MFIINFLVGNRYPIDYIEKLKWSETTTGFVNTQRWNWPETVILVCYPSVLIFWEYLFDSNTSGSSLPVACILNHGIEPQVAGFLRRARSVDLLRRFEAFDFRGEANPLDFRLCRNDGMCATMPLLLPRARRILEQHRFAVLQEFVQMFFYHRYSDG